MALKGPEGTAHFAMRVADARGLQEARTLEARLPALASQQRLATPGAEGKDGWLSLRLAVPCPTCGGAAPDGALRGYVTPIGLGKHFVYIVGRCGDCGICLHMRTLIDVSVNAASGLRIRHRPLGEQGARILVTDRSTRPVHRVLAAGGAGRSRHFAHLVLRRMSGQASRL